MGATAAVPAPDADDRGRWSEAGPASTSHRADAHSTDVALPARPGLAPSLLPALQRAVGNRAIARLVQRDNPPVAAPAAAPAASPATSPAAAPFDATTLQAGGAAPTSAGLARASAQGDQVWLEAGRIDMKAEAWVADGKELGTSGRVGFIQNLVTSDRVGVYRAGGDPAGEIIAELHDARQRRWDAGFQEKKGGGMEPHAYAPFYFYPSSIDRNNTSANKVAISMWDQPRATFAKSIRTGRGEGKLTETKGQDTFKVSVGAKGGGPAFLLSGWQGYHWTAPWEARIDAQFNGAGRAIEQSVIRDLLRDGPDPTLDRWSFDDRDVQVFEGFATPEEAAKRTPTELLKWLFPAQQADPNSYRNICAALDAKAPALQVDLACRTTEAWVGRDVVSVGVTRGNQLARSEGGIRLKSGEHHRLTVAWADLVGTASNLRPGDRITVDIAVGARSSAAAGSCPLSGGTIALAGAGFTYSATVGL